MLGLHTPLTDTVINPVVIPNTNVVNTPNSNEGYISVSTVGATNPSWLTIDQKARVGRYHVFSFMIDISMGNKISTTKIPFFMSCMKNTVGVGIDFELSTYEGMISVYGVSSTKAGAVGTVETYDIGISGKATGQLTNLIIVFDQQADPVTGYLFPAIYIDGLKHIHPWVNKSAGSFSPYNTSFMGATDRVFMLNTMHCAVGAVACHNTDVIDINNYGSYDTGSKQWFTYRATGAGWTGNSFAFDGRNVNLQDVITVTAHPRQNTETRTHWPKDSPYELGLVIAVTDQQTSSAVASYMVIGSPLLTPNVNNSEVFAAMYDGIAKLNFIENNRNAIFVSATGISANKARLYGIYNAPNKGVHCLTYIGNGGILDIPHSLGKIPKFMLIMPDLNAQENAIWYEGNPSNIYTRLKSDVLNNVMPYDIWDSITVSSSKISIQPDVVVRGTSQRALPQGCWFAGAEVRGGDLLIYSRKPTHMPSTKDNRLSYNLTTGAIDIVDTISVGNNFGAFVTHNGVDVILNATGLFFTDTGTTTLYTTLGAEFSSAVLLRAERIPALNIVVAVFKTTNIHSRMFVFKSNPVAGVEIGASFTLPSQLLDTTIGALMYHISTFALNGKTYVVIPNTFAYKSDISTGYPLFDKCMHSNSIYEVTDSNIVDTTKTLDVPGGNFTYFEYASNKYILGTTMGGAYQHKGAGYMFLATIDDNLDTTIIQVLNNGGGSFCVPYEIDGAFYLYISGSGNYQEERNLPRRYLFDGYIRNEEILPAGQASFVYPIKVGVEERLFCISTTREQLMGSINSSVAFDLLYDDSTKTYVADEINYPFSHKLNVNGRKYLVAVMTEDMLELSDVQATQDQFSVEDFSPIPITIANGLDVAVLMATNRNSIAIKDPLTGKWLPYLYTNLLFTDISFQKGKLLATTRSGSGMSVMCFDWTTGVFRTAAHKANGLTGSAFGCYFDGTNLTMFSHNGTTLYKSVVNNVFTNDSASVSVVGKASVVVSQNMPVQSPNFNVWYDDKFHWVTVVSNKFQHVIFDPVTEIVTATNKQAASGHSNVSKFRYKNETFRVYNSAGNLVVYKNTDTDPGTLTLVNTITKVGMFKVRGKYLLPLLAAGNTFAQTVRYDVNILNLDTGKVITHTNKIPVHSKDPVKTGGQIIYYDTEYLVTQTRNALLMRIAICRIDASVPDKFITIETQICEANRVGNLLHVTPLLNIDEPKKWVYTYTIDLVTGEVSSNRNNPDNRFNFTIGCPTNGNPLLANTFRYMYMFTVNPVLTGKGNQLGLYSTLAQTANTSVNDCATQLGMTLFPTPGGYKIISFRDRGIGVSIAKDALNSKMVFEDTSVFYRKNDFIFPTATIVSSCGTDTYIDENVSATYGWGKGRVINFPVFNNAYFELTFRTLSRAGIFGLGAAVEQPKSIIVSDMEVADNRYVIAFDVANIKVYELLTDTLLFTLPAVEQSTKRIGIHFVDDKVISFYENGVYKTQVTLPRPMTARSVQPGLTNDYGQSFYTYFRPEEWVGAIPGVEPISLAAVITKAKIVRETNKVYNGIEIPRRGISEMNTSDQFNADITFQNFTRFPGSSLNLNHMFGTSWAMTGSVGSNNILHDVIIGKQPYRKTNLGASTLTYRHGVPTGKREGITKLEYAGEGLSSVKFAHGLTKKPEMVMVITSKPTSNQGFLYLSAFDNYAGKGYKIIQQLGASNTTSPWVTITDSEVIFTKENNLNLFESGINYFIMFAHSVPGYTYIGAPAYNHHQIAEVTLGGKPIWGLLVNLQERSKMVGMAQYNHLDKGTMVVVNNNTNTGYSPNGICVDMSEDAFIIAFGLQHWSNAYRLTDDFKSNAPL